MESNAETIRDALREPAAHGTLRALAALEEMGRQLDDYVAWLRYKQYGDRTCLVVCDSDEPGAFLVYRKLSARAAAEKFDLTPPIETDGREAVEIETGRPIIIADLTLAPCPACSGTGKIPLTNDPCRYCGGKDAR